MRDLLNKEIEDQFLELPYMEVGSANYEKTVTGLTKLIEKEVELYKFDAERQDKLEQQKRQEELQRVKEELDRIEKQNQLDLQAKQLEMQQKQFELQAKQHKHTMWVNGLQILATVGIALIGVGVKVWGTKTTLEYEDKGVIPTTLAGREHTKQLFNK